MTHFELISSGPLAGAVHAGRPPIRSLSAWEVAYLLRRLLGRAVVQRVPHKGRGVGISEAAERYVPSWSPARNRPLVTIPHTNI